MIAIKILKHRDFMGKLLASDTFDKYLVNEVTIETFNTFNINGRLNKDFYHNGEVIDDTSTSTEAENFSTWSMLRPICLELIKGKRTPLGFKFVFYLDSNAKSGLLSSNDSELLPENVDLGLNIKFTGSEMLITTGCAYKIFTLSKDIEKVWDEHVPKFLDSINIEYEILS